MVAEGDGGLDHGLALRHQSSGTGPIRHGSGHECPQPARVAGQARPPAEDNSRSSTVGPPDPCAASPADSTTLNAFPVWESAMEMPSASPRPPSECFSSFALLPRNDRHANVEIARNVALHGGISVADLVVSPDLVEVKTHREYEGPKARKTAWPRLASWATWYSVIATTTFVPGTPWSGWLARA